MLPCATARVATCGRRPHSGAHTRPGTSGGEPRGAGSCHDPAAAGRPRQRLHAGGGRRRQALRCVWRAGQGCGCRSRTPGRTGIRCHICHNSRDRTAVLLLTLTGPAAAARLLPSRSRGASCTAAAAAPACLRAVQGGWKAETARAWKAVLVASSWAATAVRASTWLIKGFFWRFLLGKRYTLRPSVQCTGLACQAWLRVNDA